jgi:hypothetical protein
MILLNFHRKAVGPKSKEVVTTQAGKETNAGK